MAEVFATTPDLQVFEPRKCRLYKYTAPSGRAFTVYAPSPEEAVLRINEILALVPDNKSRESWNAISEYEQDNRD